LKREEVIQQRAALLAEANARKEELKSDIHHTISHVEQKGKNLLVITGVLLGTYFVLELFIRPKREVRQIVTKNVDNGPEQIVTTTPQPDSYIMKMIKEQIAHFILNMLTQTLNELISQLGHKRPKKE
jgi:hypothetical protein